MAASFLRSRLLRSTISQFSVHRKLQVATILNRPSLLSDLPLESQFFRYLSTSRRQPNRIDIGAKARQLQNRRLWTYGLTFSCIAGFIVIVLNNFEDQLVFYVTPTQALEKITENPSKDRFRLGGLVLEGSITSPSSSAETEFVITDLVTDILVRYEGSLPDLFREGHSAVVEGFVYPFTEDNRKGLASNGKTISAKATSMDYYFGATEVLAKHDEKYMPKEVSVALERNKAKLEEAKMKAAELKEAN